MAIKKKPGDEAAPISTEPAASSVPGDRKMEQIRDIIFGGLSREYDRRFQELGDRLSQEVNRVDRDVERRLTAMESRIDAAVDRLSAQVRQENNARAMAVDDLDTRVAQAMRTQRGELSAAIERIDHDLAQADSKARDATSVLHSELMTALQALRDTATQERDQLRVEKVSRDDLADMMEELSLRLRGALDLPDVR